MDVRHYLFYPDQSKGLGRRRKMPVDALIGLPGQQKCAFG